jgi:cytochrome b
VRPFAARPFAARPFAARPFAAPPGAAPAARRRTLPVWDPLVRVLHWAIAALVLTAFLSSDARHFHMAVGYIAVGLAALRIAWGFVGSRHARFTDFVRAPRTVLAYLGALARFRAPRHLGHNPAGGAMILALLGLIALAGISGWLSQTNAWFGVLWVEDVHAFAGNAIIFLAILHVAGVLVSSLAHGENLVRAMLTGRKPLVSGTGELPIEFPGELEDEGSAAAFARFGPH